jgi:predicted transcriptional regulator of viral defense system
VHHEKHNITTIKKAVPTGAYMSENTKLHPQWERFLKEFSDKLAKPSQDIPSVRCLSRTTLTSIFTEILKELELPSTFPPGVEILRLLSSMGLASAVTTEKDKTNAPSKEFYLIGISASHDVTADPFEILQAYKPSGVICFFSALSYYGLTTQLPTHHHIVTIVEPTTTTKNVKPKETFPPSSEISTKESNTKKIGTLAFSYDGTPFYTSRRSKNTIPGIKNRVLNSRTHIKIASKEQTLLDTLHYPLHCGGAEVILEAWDDQRDNLDEKSFLDLLQKIDSSLLTRRLGALFDFLDYSPNNELSLFLKREKEETQNSSELPPITLFRGLNHTHLNSEWKTLTP